MGHKHFNSIRLQWVWHSVLDKIPMTIKTEFNSVQAKQCHYQRQQVGTYTLNILRGASIMGKCGCMFRGILLNKYNSLPASIVFVALFGISKETVRFGTMRRCFYSCCGGTIAVFVFRCCGCGPQFRLRTVIIPIAIQKVGIPFGRLMLLWCNQTYFFVRRNKKREKSVETSWEFSNQTFLFFFEMKTNIHVKLFSLKMQNRLIQLSHVSIKLCVRCRCCVFR